MRRVCLFALVLGCSLGVATPALAVPHFSKSRTREISTLVARFVNDMVRRRDLADGWRIAGPDERGTLTRQQWVSGRQVPVQSYDVLNNPRTAWYPKWKTRTEIGLVLSLKTGRGKNAEMLQAETLLEKLRRGWVVDGFYVDGIFRLGAGHSGSCVSSKCKVTGLADYGAGGGGGSGRGPARIGKQWFVGGLLTVVGIALAIPLVVFLRVRARNRRALAEYLASR